MKAPLIGGVLLLAGAACVVLGILPVADAARLGERVWPVLLFVVAMTIVTELAAAAGVFTAVAGRAARWGRGQGAILWLLVVVAAVVCTAFFSLDTTAVLLTPVVVGMARHVRLDPLPFAVVTVWLANTGSLLLPVSNLTNLLTQQSATAMTTARFVALTAAPAVVAVVIPAGVVFVLLRRRILVRYDVPTPSPASDPRLRTTAAVTLAILLPLLVSGIPVWIPACAAATVLLIVFAWRQPTAVRPGLLPWRLVVLACGLFLGIQVLHELGLSGLLGAIAGTGTGPGDLLRLAFTGLVGANAVNNLPAFLALQPLTVAPVRQVALLIGVNAGALITPWASLATLLWHDRLEAAGIRIRWRRFIAASAPVAVVTVGVATLVLSWTR